jgi:hypothetical protein
MIYSLRVGSVSDLAEQLRDTDVHRAWQQFLMLTACTVAVIVALSQFAYNSVTRWYQQSGRNQVLHSITTIHSITSSLLTLTYDKLAAE